jgi:hypothetical protein
MDGRRGGTRTPNPRFWRQRLSAVNQRLSVSDPVKPVSENQRFADDLSNPGCSYIGQVVFGSEGNDRRAPHK